jgi:hypothetical protein
MHNQLSRSQQTNRGARSAAEMEGGSKQRLHNRLLGIVKLAP